MEAALVKAVVSWLLNKLWSWASEEIKDALSRQRAEEHIRKVLGDYEKVLEEAKEKAKDGLTEEEKNEIRQKKIALEQSLINNIQPN